MSINIIERAIVPYNATGSSVIFNNQYHMFAPVAGINKVGMAGYNDDFSISTSQIVSISDKFKASGLQYTDVSNLPANIVYAIDGIKSPNVVFSGYEHAVQDPTPGETGNITVKGSLLTTYSNYTDTDNYSMNEILFADGRIWFRELDVVDGTVDSITAFKISYSKDEVDSYFRTKGDSYTITQINAFLALKVNLAGAETITGKKTFSAGLSTSVAPTTGNDVVNKTYADLKVALAGTETITGKKTFSAGLDTSVAPAAGADIVNKTYADSKVPKTAIQTSVSGTPLDSNVLSEKFVNTTYRTKADSWSKADLDAHIGALETRVGNEVLNASLPGNEFGQGTLSGIINTLGSHIDSLQLGFVPRTMRNVITPLRSKDPTDLSTTDSYDELIALSEVGFVPDIPVGQTMTLVDRLNAFILADQGRAANHTDAVVCVDIQAPDRGRLITYYYWDLGTGDEYEGVPAGWYVADVNMSPDNITNIGAFTKLLSKTPVGYEEDSTGTRVFAVNGNWKKYSAADLHAIYPTLEYLGLLNLWFIILAPDVDTMNTINNYEPGKSVALVDCAHGMGIDSAISIELLKKVKDVESGSLIQNIQYCKLDQFHVLSNGLVVLYADDPFDGEVVIKTGKAYYVSGATEMMAVPMSQVTGLELVLDSKVALVDGDIKDTVVAFTEAGARANIATGESTATLFGKIKKYFTDLKAHSFVAPSATQGTGTTTVPCDKLLRESSFARVYRSLAELGLTAPVFMSDIVAAMADSSVFVSNVSVTTDFFKYKEGEAVLPANYGILTIYMRGIRARIEYSTFVSSSINKIWYCDYSPNDTLVRGWKQIIDDSSAQTISGVKTFATNATPLITDAPTTGTMAVNKTYADLKVAKAGAETITGIKTFDTGATPLITDQPTTDLMAVNKSYVDSRLAPYDKVIRNQDDFEDMIEDSDWLGAKSVALVGQFTISKASGIEIPATVKQIHGFNSAKITVTNFAYDIDTAKGGLWYDTAPTTQDYSIRDLEVGCAGTGTGTSAFYNCIGLYNCTGKGTGTGAGSGGYGFWYCTNLTNCVGTGAGTGTNSSGYGFRSCTNLTNCIGTGTGTTGGYGFQNCDNLYNCTGKGTGTSSGYGFFYIDYAVNCKDGGYTTDMWGGTNRNIDIDTCRRTPVQVTAAELTALNT
jgi:uncharacterized protein YfiM (DUF2279 family)